MRWIQVLQWSIDIDKIIVLNRWPNARAFIIHSCKFALSV